MKRRMTIVGLAVIASVVAGYSGYLFGAMRGGARAARSSNTASLVYFTAIHKALANQEYAKAKLAAEMAVDGHVGILRILDTTAHSNLYYAWPWATADPLAEANQKILRTTREYFLALPAALRPQTRQFLAAIDNPATDHRYLYSP